MAIGTGTSLFAPVQQASQGRAGGNSVLQGAESPFDAELTEEEEKQVQELKKIDTEVRAHEAAHKSAGGPVAGPVSFETVTGPDGRQYAVAGEVQIDVSPVSDNPRATIAKADIIIRAALAPANPSPQDFAVARAAQQLRQQAQKELREQETAESEESGTNTLIQAQESLATEENTQKSEISQAIQSLIDTQQLLENTRDDVFLIVDTQA